MATPRLTDVKRREIEDALKTGGTTRELAAKLGVSEGTVSNVRTGAWASTRIAELEKEVSLLSDFHEIRCHPMGVPFKRNPRRHEAVPFLLGSDWHVDEVVDSVAMNGLNAYDLDIARQRVETYFKCAVEIIGIY